jgi:hypothetical protein
MHCHTSAKSLVHRLALTFVLQFSNTWLVTNRLSPTVVGEGITRGLTHFPSDRSVSVGAASARTSGTRSPRAPSDAQISRWRSHSFLHVDSFKSRSNLRISYLMGNMESAYFVVTPGHVVRAAGARQMHRVVYLGCTSFATSLWCSQI